MQQKLFAISKYAQDFLLRLRDVKFAGLMLFMVIVLLISWSGVKSIQSNYELQKQIATLQQQNDVQKLSNTNMALENEYYKTDSYLDLEARQNFGLATPGEKEVVVPKDVALSYTVEPPAASKGVDQPKAKQSTYQRNFQGWVNFFMHRQTSL